MHLTLITLGYYLPATNPAAIDGATVELELRPSGQQVYLELDGVGAHDPASPRGQHATRALGRVLQDADLIVWLPPGSPLVGRVRGRLYADGADVGKYMVEQHHARPVGPHDHPEAARAA